MSVMEEMGAPGYNQVFTMKTERMNELKAYRATGLTPAQLAEAQTELSHSHKETAMLWKALDEARAEVERLRGEMKTAYDENHVPYHVEAEGSEAKHIIELLKAEADGLLVRLPCKAGDKVYYIGTQNYTQKAVFGTEVEDLLYPIVFRTYDFTFSKSDIGKTVFLTEQEAQQALKAMEPTP